MSTDRPADTSTNRTPAAWMSLLALLASLVFAAPAAADSGGAPPLTDARHAQQQLSAGGNTTCAIDSARALWCWGENTQGQLGNGTTDHSAVPVQVTGLTGEPTAVAVGERHACAIVTGGVVNCWGSNGQGELGDGGTNSHSSTPVVATVSSTPAAELGLGLDVSCALLVNGDIQCWGTAPGSITNGGPFSALAVGTESVCAVSAAGQLVCGPYGGALVSVGIPGAMVGVATGWGSQRCGLGSTGLLTCGTDAGIVSATPSVSSAATGRFHTCAARDSGTVSCWFNGNVGVSTINVSSDLFQSQLGPAEVIPAIGQPDIAIPTITDAVAVAAGTHHTCAALASGEVACWGGNTHGQTTDPATAISAEPVRFLGGQRGTALATGRDHTCFQTLISGPLCVGDRTEGQAGTPSPGPTRIGVTTEGTRRLYPNIDARGDATCGVSNESVYCWGSGGVLQFIASLPDDGPDRIFTRIDTRQVALGGDHACIRRGSIVFDDVNFGRLRCFGDNTFGQVDGVPSDPKLSSVLAPFAIVNRDILSVDAGANHTCALAAPLGLLGDDSIWCWGSDTDGQTGPANANNFRPVPLAFEPVDLASGSAHNCAVRVDGRIACWGRNTQGQLGRGDTQPTSSPGQSSLVTGITDATQVFAGLGHTCAIHEGKTMISCWGVGASGQLGNGEMTDSPSPVEPVGLPAGVQWETMALGQDHTCAVTAFTSTPSLEAYCWGNGENGELGNLASTDYPRIVIGLQITSSVSAVFCNGKSVTIDLNLGASGVGTSGDDVILGTSTDDVIDGGDGNDTICAGPGDDVVVGGNGDDTIFGNAGRDVLRGNPGEDTINGGDGPDRLLGGIDNDVINGGAGDDYIGGFGGSDTINGGAGNETIFGGFGADIINGGQGADKIFGLIGNDTINGGPGDDLLNGDRGNDIINGGGGNDIISGGNANDILSGNAGDDIVNGGKADDTLSGGPDTDVCTGNKNLDTADATCETTFGVP